MAKTTLTKKQSDFLKYFSSTSSLSINFYLSGGTALSEYYLKHRFSEDLDFFSENEFEPNSITPYIKKAKKKLNFIKFDYQRSFNRNIFQILFSDKSFLKVEFTYFPFIQIEKPEKINGVLIDSLIDIAVNKVFTIHQSPRGRDFFDLYMIIENKKWEIKDLINYARVKFDTKVDPLQLGTQFLKVKTLLDDPIIMDSVVTKTKIEDFFLQEASSFKSSILK